MVLRVWDHFACDLICWGMCQLVDNPPAADPHPAVLRSSVWVSHPPTLPANVEARDGPRFRLILEPLVAAPQSLSILLAHAELIRAALVSQYGLPAQRSLLLLLLPLQTPTGAVDQLG